MNSAVSVVRCQRARRYALQRRGLVQAIPDTSGRCCRLIGCGCLSAGAARRAQARLSHIESKPGKKAFTRFVIRCILRVVSPEMSSFQMPIISGRGQSTSEC